MGWRADENATDGSAVTIPKDNPGGMSEATVTGTKPFPLT
jgi:hypothetical protein